MRKNHPKNARPTCDRYEVGFVDLPQAPHVRQLVSRTMKTVYRNLSAAPWATESPVVEVFDENFAPVYQHKR